MDLWHVREENLPAGTIIAPGRWGEIITVQGQAHPFFYREQLLELYRVSKTTVRVSRLACAFAFEERAIAAEWALDGSQYLHRVSPVLPEESGVRVDMLWLSWMGEPASTFVSTLARCENYWHGRSTRDVSPTANPAWEWLFAGGLRVITAEAP